MPGSEATFGENQTGIDYNSSRKDQEEKYSITQKEIGEDDPIDMRLREEDIIKPIEVDEFSESVDFSAKTPEKEIAPESLVSSVEGKAELENGKEKVQLTEKDIEECRESVKERAEKDYIEALHVNTKTSLKENWKTPRLTEENAAAKLSAETWAETRVASDLQDILDEKKAKEEHLEVGDVKWNRMAEEVQEMIKKQEWKKIIPRVGSMNNLDSVKFRETILPLFNDTDYKEKMLEQVQKARESAEGIGRDINPWELASTVRYVSECFPALRNEVKFSGKDWGVMQKYLKDVREREWGVKELTEFGEKSEYWKVAHLEKNMKIIQEMIDNGDIKVSEENDVENDAEDGAVKNDIEANAKAEQKKE